jgi:plasmid stabilization system protein ParE
MSLVIQKTPSYHADVTSQFGWYFDEAGEELAWRFFNATDQTLYKLASQPDLGRRRKFRHPMLRNLYSFQVERPFQKILIFIA